MRTDSVALIFASVALSSVSQLILKRGMTTQDMQNVMNVGAPTEIVYKILSSPLVLGGVCCFGLSAFLWLFVLSRVPLSTAYPFVAMGIFVTVLAGAVVFAEPLTIVKAIGVGLIMSGIVLVGFGS